MNNDWQQTGVWVWHKYTKLFDLCVWRVANQIVAKYRCEVNIITYADSVFLYDGKDYETLEQAQIAAEDLLRLEFEAELARLG